MKKITFSIVIILLLVATICFAYFYSNGFMAKYVESEIDIPYGTSAYGVIDILKENEIIKTKLLMKYHYKQRAADSSFQLQSGKVTLNSKMSYDEILDILSKPRSGDFVLTIPEGYEISQIVPLIAQTCQLDEQEIYNEIENGQFDYDFLKTDELPKGKTRLEGYLFPDTYFINKTDSAHDIINLLLARFDSVFTEEYRARAKQLEYSIHEITTLASIIEKECSVDLDIVSSVFHNRLKSRDFPYLESCATIIYVTKSPRDRLTYDDINVKSPYNTYLNRGLSPGPIASPGKEAIHAALYPADTDYYYFSAASAGVNTFSRTYEEHLQKNKQ